MAQSISNESVCIRDSESVAVARADDYVLTLANGGRFLVSCVAVPGVVIAQAVDRVSEGEDLRGIIFNEWVMGDLKHEVKMVSTAGCILGGVVGVIAAVTFGNLALLPLYAIGGAVAVPYAVFNGIGLTYTVAKGVPMAFRAAAKMVVNSRPARALTAGAPEVRATLKGLTNKPICRVRKPGLK